MVLEDELELKCSDDVGCLIIGYHFGKIVFLHNLSLEYVIGEYGRDPYNFLVVFASFNWILVLKF